MTNIIDGQLWKKLVSNGCENFKLDVENINNLNVFPIPDGDTGTNMKMTIEGGINATLNSDETSIQIIAKAMSRAMLMSARGNSGVILSQFFKGIFNGLQGHDQVNVKEFADAFESGVKQSYAVVKNPTEGTILTVMREASAYALKNIDDNSSLEDYFVLYVKEARESLQRTPDLLPCLKEAGVVDSGGQGLLRIVEGMALYLDGNILASDDGPQTMSQATAMPLHTNFNADSILEFGYCTEFILQLMNYKCNPETFDLNTITSYLETIGDSIVAFKDESIIKVHVHTKTPGMVFNYCQQFGEFVTLKVENMSVQNSDLDEKHASKKKKVEHKKYALVAVSSGEGISDAFKELGVDEIVGGGQTMNPSAEDFINAFNKIDAEHIIVFPNNSNIIMAATQAAENYDKCDVRVIRSKSLAQCYSALTMMDLSSDDIDTICSIFEDEINNVSSGEVTYSIRDTDVDGVHISKGDYITIINHRIVASSLSKIDAFKEILNNVEDIDWKEVMVIIYGEDVTNDEKEEIRAYLSSTYPNIEVGEIEGKQKVYSFLVSVE